MSRRQKTRQGKHPKLKLSVEVKRSQRIFCSRVLSNRTMMHLSSADSSPTSVTSKKIEPITSNISPWLISIAYPLGQFVVLPFYFGDIQVSGQENIPKEGPVILAPTHRARWDALILPYATGRYVSGRDLRFMVTADEVQGLQGWFIRRLGGFPVNVRNPGISSLRHGVELLLNRQMMVIFPEGGIFRDDQLHSLKPGLARIALQAESMQANLGVKIVPISIHYGDSNPGWRSGASIRIGKPLNVADYAHEPVKRAAQKLTQNLETAIRQIDQPRPFSMELPALSARES